VVPEHGVVAVLGANGAGKTSLLRAISGASEARSGLIRFDGAEIQNRPPWAVAAEGVAHVPEGRELFPHLSVVDNLRVGAWLRRRREVGAEMDRVLALFPALAARRGMMAASLSGGEQQMLAIGRALMARPRLVLLDEPSLGLAPAMVRSIYDLVVRLRSEVGAALLLVEQHAELALELADFGYVLENGRVVLEGEAWRLREHPDVREAYLGIREGEMRPTRRWRRRKRWR